MKLPRPFLKPAMEQVKLELTVKSAAEAQKAFEEISKKIAAAGPSFASMRAIAGVPQYPFGTMLEYHSPLGYSHGTGMVISADSANSRDIGVFITSGDGAGTIQSVPLQTWKPIE